MNQKETLLQSFFLEMENDFKQEYYSGNLYNIFNELSINTDEVKHSLFLSGLLNPNGFHGCNDIFLKAFLKEIGLDEEEWLQDYANLSFECEFFIGNRNHKKNLKENKAKNYGRIDILIEHKKQKKGLIIENKIYAKDQPEQLKRYYNFAIQRYKKGSIEGEINKDFYIYYLTLDRNQKPTELSLDGLKINDIKLISYEKEILSFLEKVLLRQNIDFSSQPINSNILDVVRQYDSILKQLTNKTNYFINKIYQIEKYRNKIEEIDLIKYRSNLRKCFFEDLKKELIKEIPKKDVRFVYSINHNGEDTDKSLNPNKHKKNFGIEIKVKDILINIEVQNWSRLIYGVFKRTETIEKKEILIREGYNEDKYWIYKHFEIKNSSNVPFPFYDDYLNHSLKDNTEIINDLISEVLNLYKNCL